VNVFEILPNLRLIVMPEVVMMNITPVVVIVMSLVMVRSSSVITVPFLVMMPIAILGIGYRGHAWNN
jgi:hypothetical protein